MAVVVRGLVLKREVSPDGQILGNIPFMPKTFSKLVFNQDGTTVEGDITELKSKQPLIFDTIEDYYNRYNTTGIPSDVMCIIKE